MAKTKPQSEWLVWGGMPLAARMAVAILLYSAGASLYLYSGHAARGAAFIALAFVGYLFLCRRSVDLRPRDFRQDPKNLEWSRTNAGGLKAAAETIRSHSALKANKVPAWIVILSCAVLFVLVTAAFSGRDREMCFVLQILCFYLLPLATGSVRDWCPSDFLLVAPQQLAVMSLGERYSERASFSAQVGCDKKYSIPISAKSSVRLKGAPEGFYGIQVQTTLTDVQGIKHPFTYCVIAAKPETGLKAAYEKFLKKPTDNPVVKAVMTSKRYKTEMKTEGDVCCILTTLASDYETSVADALNITEGAINLAELLLGLG